MVKSEATGFTVLISSKQTLYISLQLACLLHPGSVSILPDQVQFILESHHSRIAKGLAFPVGVYHRPVNGDHPADQFGGIFSTLHFKGVQTQVHVVPKLFSIDDKGNVWIALYAAVDFLDFFVAVGTLQKHFTPFLIG